MRVTFHLFRKENPMHTIIKIIGLIIIVLSFIYILKRPNQSLMEALMEKRRAQSQREQDEKEPDHHKY